MKPIPLQPNMPQATSALGNPVGPTQWYECPHCHKPSPLTRTWVGLTEEEAMQIIDTARNGSTSTFGFMRVARAIEAALKEKNQ